mmetsp:Transcript_106712/g.340656  ORF Transcript_106712/g.340656 Transcript_106712/m.340656 type:complete len:203 (-) Transcript_106712:399-1007(-)
MGARTPLDGRCPAARGAGGHCHLQCNDFGTRSVGRHAQQRSAPDGGDVWLAHQHCREGNAVGKFKVGGRLVLDGRHVGLQDTAQHDRIQRVGDCMRQGRAVGAGPQRAGRHGGPCPEARPGLLQRCHQRVPEGRTVDLWPSASRRIGRSQLAAGLHNLQRIDRRGRARSRVAGGKRSACGDEVARSQTRRGELQLYNAGIGA